MMVNAFDKHDRKIIENMGLNCIYIDKDNKDCVLKDLDYINKRDGFIVNNEKVLNSTLLSRDTFESFGIHAYPLPILIVDPRY